MRFRGGKSFVILCLALLALTAATAHADPIRVTGGKVGFFFVEPTGVSLTGDGLVLAGDGIGSAVGPSHVGALSSLDGSFHFDIGLAPHPRRLEGPERSKPHLP
jgi:hypothetical protein